MGEPVRYINESLTAMLQGMGQTNAVILGLVLGAMMAFDMGGPVNKAAYAFSVGLLTSDTFGPMAATMAAGMTPPLGLAVATFIAKNRFTEEEREAGKAAFVLGLSFITEGAIPYAARDPLRVIPSIMVGSALTGALSMYFGCGLRAPHGGAFVLAIPHAVSNLSMYILSILIGTAVTTALLVILKRPVNEVACCSGCGIKRTDARSQKVPSIDLTSFPSDWHARISGVPFLFAQEVLLACGALVSAALRAL